MLLLLALLALPPRLALQLHGRHLAVGQQQR